MDLRIHHPARIVVTVSLRFSIQLVMILEPIKNIDKPTRRSWHWRFWRALNWILWGSSSRFFFIIRLVFLGNQIKLNVILRPFLGLYKDEIMSKCQIISFSSTSTSTVLLLQTRHITLSVIHLSHRPFRPLRYFTRVLCSHGELITSTTTSMNSNELTSEHDKCIMCHVHLRASTNEQSPAVDGDRLSWEALELSQWLCEKYKAHASVSWHLTVIYLGETSSRAYYMSIRVPPSNLVNRCVNFEEVLWFLSAEPEFSCNQKTQNRTVTLPTLCI